MAFKLNLLAFIVAFSVGLFFIYMFTPPPEVVVKFPTPWNAGRVVYRDAQDHSACYVINATNEACPADRHMIKPQPSAATYMSDLM
jgi:hypothetical protein